MPPVSAFQTYAEDLHKLGYRGQGITVAVVDSGVDLSDPETAKAVTGGQSLVPGGDPGDVQDQIGHGSLVTRIILTIAPEAKIYPVRIFGNTGATTEEIAGRGLEIAAAMGDLTNASIGGPDHPAIQLGIRAHESRSMPLVAAAGNSGDGQADTPEREFPAADPYCTAIGAVDRGLADPAWDWAPVPLKPAEYSSSYPEVDAVAIGRIPGSWDQGTSFAAPVVAGLIACYMSMAIATGRPHDDDACYAWLINHCRQLSGLPARNDQTGYGLVTTRPYQLPRILEVDVETLAARLNGYPVVLSEMGVVNKAPGGLYGWIRPFAEQMGLRVSYDATRRKAQYRS